MDNKLNNMINEFLTNTDAKNIDELNNKLQEFIQKYNAGEIEYKNTLLDDAYEILEKAENSDSKEQAIKYAKKAYNMCPECFDALLFQVDLENNPLKRMKLLNKGLELEEKRLKKEGYFEKDNIGHFYGIFETRPYIRGLYSKVEYLIIDGKMRQACNICKEILKLNSNDNMGTRYILMALYAYLEEESNILKLYKKYPEEELEMLFPLFAIYYKKEDDKKTKYYLNKINESNPHFIKYFKCTIKRNPKIEEGYYSKGDSSEVIMYFNKYSFLTETLPTIDYYVLEKKQ